MEDLMTVYPRTAVGVVEPLRTISTSNTGGLAVDTLNNEIFITRGVSIDVYARTANATDAPLRTISASLGDSADDIAVDILHNEVFVMGGRISVYMRTANGEVQPSRTISGVASGLNSFGHIILL